MGMKSSLSLRTVSINDVHQLHHDGRLIEVILPAKIISNISNELNPASSSQTTSRISDTKCFHDALGSAVQLDIRRLLA